MATFNTIVALVLFLGIALISPSTAQDTQQDFLDAHNSARAQVGQGLSPMTWDKKLADFALNYARKHSAGNCMQLVHSGGPYGENLAGSSGDMSGRDAVNMWVAEKANYDYNSNTCAPGKVCGHYTQVVWRDSLRVGCAKVKCNDGGTWIGCNYDPPGNIIGQKPY